MVTLRQQENQTPLTNPNNLVHIRLIGIDPGDVTGIAILDLVNMKRKKYPIPKESVAELFQIPVEKIFGSDSVEDQEPWIRKRVIHNQLNNLIAVMDEIQNYSISAYCFVDHDFPEFLKGHPTGKVSKGQLDITEVPLGMYWLAEDYLLIPGQKFKQSTAPLRILGAIEYAWNLYRLDRNRKFPSDVKLIKPVFRRTQTPQYRLAANDGLLKHFGLYKPGMKHANDAMRHILTFLMDRNTKELLPEWTKSWIKKSLSQYPEWNSLQ